MRADYHISDVILSGIADGPTVDAVDANLHRLAAEVIPLLQAAH